MTTQEMGPIRECGAFIEQANETNSSQRTEGESVAAWFSQLYLVCFSMLAKGVSSPRIFSPVGNSDRKDVRCARRGLSVCVGE